jgi:hypothetical protein
MTVKKAPAKKVAPKKRIRYRIGQVAWCPQLGGFVILGIRRRKEYRNNLLVATYEDDRFWIDQDIIQQWPSARQKAATVAERFSRLLTHDTACMEN